MLSPRKKYIYSAIFGLACVGFVIDRIIGPGPAEAGAKETATEPNKPPVPVVPAIPTDATTPSSARNETPAASAPASPAAQGIKRLPEIGQVRDLFRPPVEEAASSEAERARQKEVEVDVVAAFVAAHRLQGTIRDGAVRLAMVDGRSLGPGQVLGGFRLERVEAFRAVFMKDGRQAVLSLPETGAGPETRGTGK